MLKFSPNDKRMFTAKICDFGLAHMCYGEISASMFGTISHMPPELLMDGRLTFASGKSPELIQLLLLLRVPYRCCCCCCCCCCPQHLAKLLMVM